MRVQCLLKGSRNLGFLLGTQGVWERLVVCLGALHSIHQKETCRHKIQLRPCAETQHSKFIRVPIVLG